MIGGIGTWWVKSKADPRWNKEGRAFGSVMCGGPQELQDWIAQCASEYGEPPADAEMGFMKD